MLLCELDAPLKQSDTVIRGPSSQGLGSQTKNLGSHTLSMHAVFRPFYTPASTHLAVPPCNIQPPQWGVPTPRVKKDQNNRIISFLNQTLFLCTKRSLTKIDQ